MIKYCCVPLFGRFGGHKFPSDDVLRLKWRVAIKRMDRKTKKKLWNPGKEDILCHAHFPSMTTEPLNQVSIPILSVKIYRQFSNKLG